jgi:hypothetical protein
MVIGFRRESTVEGFARVAGGQVKSMAPAFDPGEWT